MASPIRNARLMFADWVARNEAVYRKCLGVVERHRGDNQGDIATNGELRVMREFLPRARIVFDVGANCGDWTAFALTVNRSAEYHCFEPSLETFRRLREREWPAGVIPRNIGLSDLDRDGVLFILEEGGGMNSVYDRAIGVPGRQEHVSFTTADKYCWTHGIDRVDFMKIDVEGHELNVLKGSEGLLRRGRIGAVQFEYGGTYLDARVQLRDVYETVRGFNSDYSLFKVTASGLRAVPEYHRSLEVFQLSNWIFKHHDHD